MGLMPFGARAAKRYRSTGLLYFGVLFWCFILVFYFGVFYDSVIHFVIDLTALPQHFICGLECAGTADMAWRPAGGKWYA
jgi:hypothetical protein